MSQFRLRMMLSETIFHTKTLSRRIGDPLISFQTFVNHWRPANYSPKTFIFSWKPQIFHPKSSFFDQDPKIWLQWIWIRGVCLWEHIEGLPLKKRIFKLQRVFAPNPVSNKVQSNAPEHSVINIIYIYWRSVFLTPCYSVINIIYIYWRSVFLTPCLRILFRQADFYT